MKIISWATKSPLIILTRLWLLNLFYQKGIDLDLDLLSYRLVVDVVSELPSLTHAQLSEPSIQLTALPVPYTTDYTFMHNSQHAHNISMPHYSPSFLSSRQFESCCGSVRTSRRPSPLSLLSGISTATHYIHTYYILISGRLTLHWCQN